MGARQIYSVLKRFAGRKSQSGVFPPDIEKTIALRAAHAGDALLEPRAGAAVGADAVAGTPGGRQAGRVLRPRYDRPPGRWRGQNFQCGTRERPQPAVDVEHSFGG